MNEKDYLQLIERYDKLEKSAIIIRKEENGIRIVIIDYLQLMNETNDNNNQENLNISRSLKEIANELNITVIALSQLYRPVQHRANRHPEILDLPDKNIAQYADIVAFIHRPEYYHIVVEDDESNSLLGIAKIIIAKNRNGILGDVLLRFKSRFFKFLELDEITQRNEGEAKI